MVYSIEYIDYNDRRNITIEEKERLKSLLKMNNHSDEELELITDFFLNDQKYKKTPLDDIVTLEKKNKLEKIYANLVNREQEKISEYKDIQKMIVMVSYAEILDIDNILFELPIEKSIRIFPNLDTFYLLYTSGTEDVFKDVSKKLTSIFKKNGLKNINIFGKKVENTIESIYPYLKELVREGKISKNDTILDLTTGMKVAGIALYKLAVERGIKIINWKEEFLALPSKSNEKPGKNIRIPFSVCLEILKEPIKESSKNYENINSALKNKEYSLVANLFNVIGDEDKAFLFEKIDKIFSLNFMLSFESNSFFQELKNIVKEIISYKNFTADTRKKMKDFLALISVLAFYEETYSDDTIEDETVVDDENWRNALVKLFGSSMELSIDEMIDCCYPTEDKSILDKDNIYDYITLTILDSKFKSDNNEFINEKLLEFISKFIQVNKTSKSIKDELNILLDKKIKEKLDKALNLEKAFKMDIQKTIYIKNGILTIEKFNLNIDLAEYESSKLFMNRNNQNFNSVPGKLIMKTLESPNYQLHRDDFSTIISESGNEKILYKVKSEAVVNLNNIINNELKKIRKEPKDFLISDFKPKDNYLGLYPIIVNEEFYI